MGDWSYLPGRGEATMVLKHASPAMTRRALLERSGTALSLAAAASVPYLVSGCSPPAARDTIKVGILHSLTGSMAISARSLADAELLAIEEINAAGGVLGRQIEAVVEDARSKFTVLFPKKARKLLLEDKVVVIFGCRTSDGRKSTLPVLEEHNGLLFYPVAYEGNESSRNVVYAGAAPNQQILPALDWLLSQAGGSKKRFYLLGTDYISPRTANLIVGKYLQSRGLQAVGERYTPMGHKDYKTIVQDIKQAAPDVIFSTINGESNVYFFDELGREGITADQVPVVSVSMGEDELRNLLPSKVQGHLAAWNYFQSVNTPKNKEFVQKFKDEFGSERVTDDPIEAAFLMVHLWKMAVERAGSTDVDKVRAALRSGIEYDAPEGKVRVDPKTQHTYKWFRMGRVRADRQFDIIYESPSWIEPDPYPQVAFPGWHCDWTKGGITRGPDVKIGQ
jgi:urea transport system substrate-binding protein